MKMLFILDWRFDSKGIKKPATSRTMKQELIIEIPKAVFIQQLTHSGFPNRYSLRNLCEPKGENPSITPAKSREI
jgi:hypothetical protein